MKKLIWTPSPLGGWEFLREVQEDGFRSIANYLVEPREDGTVAVEYNFSTWTEIARFDTEEEAKNYAEVCYRMGIRHEA